METVEGQIIEERDIIVPVSIILTTYLYDLFKQNL